MKDLNLVEDGVHGVVGNTAGVLSLLHQDVATLSPASTPGVLHDEVRSVLVSNTENSVVELVILAGGVTEDASTVVLEGRSNRDRVTSRSHSLFQGTLAVRNLPGSTVGGHKVVRVGVARTIPGSVGVG